MAGGIPTPPPPNPPYGGPQQQGDPLAFLIPVVVTGEHGDPIPECLDEASCTEQK